MASNNTRLAEAAMLLLLFVITIIVGLLNFGTSYPNFPDSEKYLLLVDMFRGEIPLSETVAPFNYRVLLPLLAAILPLDPELSIPIINLGLLMVLAYLLYLFPRYFGYGVITSGGAAILCMLSHPVLQYGTAVLVETPFMVFLGLSIYAILKRWDWRIILALVVTGVLIKETVIIAVLVYMVYDRERFRFAVLTGVVALGVYLAVRLAFAEAGSFWVWKFHLMNLLERPLQSFQALYLGFLFVGLPLLLAVLFREKERWRFDRAAGWFGQAALPLSALGLVGFFFGYFSVRFIWPVYFGMVPLVAHGLRGLLHVIHEAEVA